MNGAMAPALTTARVCCDVPEAMLVSAHAASNWMSGLTTKQMYQSFTVTSSEHHVQYLLQYRMLVCWLQIIN